MRIFQQKNLDSVAINNMNNEPYTCDKCHKEIQKGKPLWAKKINKKLLLICFECKNEVENAKEKN